MKKILPILLITLLYGSLLYFSWMQISADESYVSAQQQLQEGNYEKAMELSNKSIAKNPYEPRYYYGRAKVLLASTVVDLEEKEMLKKSAYDDMRKAVELNPKNLVTMRNLVPVYYFLVTDDLRSIGSSNNIDENYVTVTKIFFNNVKHYSPNDVGLPTLTAKYEKDLGFMDMYKESVAMVKALRPDLLEWQPNFTR